VSETPEPAQPQREQHSGFGPRFAFMYGALGAILVAAIVGVVIVARQPGAPKPPAWSTWMPQAGSSSKVTAEIAQLVAVVPSDPELTRNTKVRSVSTIAIRVSSSSQNFSRIIATKGNVQMQFCGLGSECAITRGEPSSARERLVRREALEVALYTFKYAPSVSAVIAYMPPPPGQAPTTLLYLERSNLSHQLKQPLSKTLPLTTPPLPSQPDPKESATIDKLTLPVEYGFGYQALPNGTEALILTPTSY